jgi:peptide/nickel transport system substrate-binding protein
MRTSSVRRRAGLLAAVAAVVVLVATACGGGGSAVTDGWATGEPHSGGTFTLANLSDAGTLDPARCGTNDWGACSAVFGTLLTYDAAAQTFRPGMAESFTSDDGKVWTLTLRQGLTFTDGTPFDAAAVVYNWERIKDPANLSAGRGVASSMTWSVVDPRTVRVVLAAPNHQLPWALYNELAMIGSPAAIAAKGRDFANAPVGAGPFTVQSWQRGTQLTLTRNPGYWDAPRPYVDTLVLKAIPAEDQRINAVRSGDVDAAVGNQPTTPGKVRESGLATTELQYPLGVGVRMNFGQGDLVDRDVRAAVAKLIDAEQLRAAFWPELPVLQTMAPEGSPYFDATATYPAKDVAGAQALVDGYLQRTGKSGVTLEMKTLAGNPVADAQAQMLQAQLQAAKGVTMSIVAQDAAVWFADTQRGNYQVQVFGVSGVNPDQLYKYFHTGASGNTSGFSDPEVDRLLDLTHSSADPAQQQQAFKDAVAVLTEKLAYRAWSGTTVTAFAQPGRVGGLQLDFTYFIRPDLVWKAAS